MPSALRERYCVECGASIKGAPRGRRYCDEHRVDPRARYKQRHREKVLACERSRQAQKRRAAGMHERGTPESSARISSVNTAKAKRGPDHPNWKGDEVGYFALHDWVERNKERTGRCEWCGATPNLTHFANLSGDYRRDVADFAELCLPCHYAYDRGGKRWRA